MYTYRENSSELGQLHLLHTWGVVSATQCEGQVVGSLEVLRSSNEGPINDARYGFHLLVQVLIPILRCPHTPIMSRPPLLPQAYLVRPVLVVTLRARV